MSQKKTERFVPKLVRGLEYAGTVIRRQSLP